MKVAKETEEQKRLRNEETNQIIADAARRAGEESLQRMKEKLFLHKPSKEADEKEIKKHLAEMRKIRRNENYNDLGIISQAILGNKSKGEILPTLIGVIIIAMCVGRLGVAIHKDNIDAVQHANQVRPLWDKWVEFRDSNCHVTQRLYGISMSNGKFHYNDNMTSYECNNGVTYSVTRSVEEEVKSCYPVGEGCSLQMERIPQDF